MKDENQKRNFIEASTTRPKHLKRIRTGVKISPIGLILLCSMVAIGMLTGLLYQMFTVTIEGDVELTGQMKPLFSFDGNEFETPYLNLSQDLTALTGGQTLSFGHYIINEDAGTWVVDIAFGDLSFYDEPTHQFYGLNITYGNIKLDGVPTTEMVLSPGQNLSFNITWSLHHEFVTAEDPFPSQFVITLTRFVDTILAVDDNQLITGSTTNIMVLSNDDVGQGVHITSVTQTGLPSQTVTIDPTGQYVIFETYNGAWTTATFEYTISADLSPEVTDVGQVTVHL